MKKRIGRCFAITKKLKRCKNQANAVHQGTLDRGLWCQQHEDEWKYTLTHRRPKRKKGVD